MIGQRSTIAFVAGLLLSPVGPPAQAAPQGLGGGPIQVLARDMPVQGTLGPGDAALQDVTPGNPGDATWTDVYTFSGAGGQNVTLSVTATVPVYLLVLDTLGRPLVDAGNDGDDMAPTVSGTLPMTGTYQVVVNSFHGTTGNYSLVLSSDRAEPSALPPPVPLAIGATVPGAFTTGDLPLEALVAGNEGDATWSDQYAFEALAGQGVTVEVTANVPVYHAVLTGDRTLVTGDGTAGDQQQTRIVYVPASDQRLVTVVNSYNGDLGSYTLTVRPATEAELQELSDQMTVDGSLEPGEPINDRIVLSERIYRTWVVDVPEGASRLSIESGCAENIDLFVRHGRQIIATWNVEPDFSATTPEGDEVVLISEVSDPALEPGRYYIDVAALIPVDERDAAELVPFTLRADIQQTVIPVVIEAPRLDAEGMVTGMFAAQLRPGSPISARIEPNVSPLQVWTVPVPPSADHLEIRTYDSTGRLDLVATPPGMNLPNAVGALLEVPYRAMTARDDERLRIDATSNPPLRAGNYTVAVLDLYSEAATDYQIAVSFDEVLMAADTASGRRAISRDEEDPERQVFGAAGLGAAPEQASVATTPLEQAIRSTVQITLSLDEGSLDFGSGSILTPDGIILTNHHVIGTCEHRGPHLMGCEGDIYRNADGSPVDLFIGLSSESRSSAEQRYMAHVLQALPDYDLALLQIDSDLDGRPVSVDLPSLPLAVDLADVRIGDGVSVIGYPGVAGLGSRISLSVTRGTVTGFTDDRGQRVLLNVDANIGGGNSGGALVNEQGILVGVPSNSNLIRERGERQDYARSLNLLPAEWITLLGAHGADIR